MGIAAAIVAGSVIAGGASLLASSSASGAASHAADENNALQQQIYNTNKGLETPSINRGNAAGDALQSFLGLGGDPAKTQAAFNNYLNSTGYQFTRQQGIDSAEQSASAKGLLNSGAALKALQDRGTGLAQQYGQNYIGNLSDVANRGAASTNALAGVGTNYANSVSSNNNNAATVAGNAAVAGAGQVNGIIGNAFSAYGASRGASSFGGGGSGNAMAGGAATSPYLLDGFGGIG